MNLTRNDRIGLMIRLGKSLQKKDKRYQKVVEKATAENPWFTVENIDKAVDSIVSSFLNPDLIKNWLSKYPIIGKPKKVGLIMAGNIPLVGFHDFMVVFLSGHHALIKLSSKDEALMKYVFELLHEIDEKSTSYFTVLERLQDFDAVIATGSNNTSRYFEYYFGKYPNIIRKNRNGVAILTGKEQEDDLRRLSFDVFDFFGLGCRSITKLFVPKDYNFEFLLGIFEENQEINNHHKYRNNFDYNYATYLLNKDVFLVSKNIILKEDISYLSRIACLHYENYDDMALLKKKLVRDEMKIQCIATKSGTLTGLANEVEFGQTQRPKLEEYADGVDTMKFLSEL